MIETIWSYVTAPENRDTLTWLGGGVAAVAAALWTAITFFAGKDRGPGGGKSAEVASQDIRADGRGHAAGRDINQNSGNTTRISTGVSGWQVVAIAFVFGGVILLAVAQVGSRVTVDDGSVGIGGDVQGSSIEVGQ